MRSRLESILLPLAVAVVFVLGWHFAVTGSGSDIFPTPEMVVTGTVELARKGVLLKYVVASLFRVSTGYLLAVFIGIPAGLLMGWFGRARLAFNPAIQVLRPISPIAWIPIAILWFGVSDLAPIFLIFLASLVPITTAAMAAVQNIQLVYIRAARNFGVKGLALFKQVVFPAALPQILTGVRVGFGVAFIVVIVAEMIAVNDGLGYRILEAREFFWSDKILAGMITIGLLGLGIDTALSRLSDHLLRWHRGLETR